MMKVIRVPQRPRRSLALVAAVVGLFGVQLVASGSAFAVGAWVEQDSGTSSDAYYGVECPTTASCFAVGDGLIDATTDGGVHWARQNLPSSVGLARMSGMSCASELVCTVVGASGTVLTTSDGGLTWVKRSTPVGSTEIIGVSCPGVAVCYAVGRGGTIIKSSNAGRDWTEQPSGTGSDLFGVSCTTPVNCVVVGWTGTVVTSDGGLSWANYSPPGVTNDFWQVDCPTVANCVAVGSDGVVFYTVTAGRTWAAGVSGVEGSGKRLQGVSCPSPTHCIAVGEAGWAIETFTASVALAWSGAPYAGGNGDTIRDVSCADDAHCWAVGSNTNGKILTNSPGAEQAQGAKETVDEVLAGLGINTLPSNHCTAPAATVVDGFFGSVYARLKVQQQGSDAWVCTRLQQEGGDEIAGGKLIVSDTGPVDNDDQYGACSTASGNIVPTNHPATSGAIGAPGDLYYTPYLLDSYANNGGDAWLCLRAGLGARLMFDSAATPRFDSDDPAVARQDQPVRTAWRAGKESTVCESQTEGGRTRLVNAVIAGTQVWLTAWQSNSKVELCYRAEGATSAGGRLTLDTSAVSPGVSPVLEPGFDTTGCTKPEFSDNVNNVHVRRSPDGVIPASVCVTLAGSTIRLTAGYTGTPAIPGVVSWRQDS